jgi:putative endonuclease
MFTVYILQSVINSKYYVGHTDDIIERLSRHNRGAVLSTKSGKPWKLIYKEDFETRSGAYRRELEMKRYKGGIQFKNLLLKK